MTIYLVHSQTKGCEPNSQPASVHFFKANAEAAAARLTAQRYEFIGKSMTSETDKSSPLPIRYFVRPARLGW
jgi:hypothetical protein